MIYRILKFGHVSSDPNWETRSQLTDFHTFILIASGKLHVQASGHNFVASKGEVLFYPKEEDHCEQSDYKDPCEIYFFNFEGETEDFPSKTTDKTGRLQTLLNWCLLDQQMELKNQLNLKELYLNLFIEEYKKVIQLHTLPDHIVQKTTHYMEEHLSRNIRLEDLAAHNHMSKSYFVKEFKKCRGITPMEELRLLRVKKAREILVSTTIPIKNIPEKVGILNEYHLSKLFKKYFNATPGSYRKS